MKQYKMKDLRGKAPALLYSYDANTYFKRLKSCFQANKGTITITFITVQRQEKEEVKPRLLHNFHELIKTSDAIRNPDYEDFWKVSLVQEHILILKRLRDEMQGRVIVSQAFSSTMLL